VLVVLRAFILSVGDCIYVDANTSICAAANPGAYRGEIAARTDHAYRCRLRNEDSVAVAVGRHRVRARRLWDCLDQEFGSCIDYPEHGAADRSICAQIVALVALVEPDLVRTGDIYDVNGVRGRDINNLGARVARVIARSAAQQYNVIRSGGGAEIEKRFAAGG
jgi:hypothetical protein